ncbi:uncharacterized protein HMPREF1541_01643 [Cyphellophora europaea CBS 101466]|uniref:Zn(2)-C6 fungal-type domain-containing protein n=1 Tax=Cyphellophora europaea (strain CBS 101466) TaxID=1220924 RepID=W2S1D5_CYPE1|nr:uncharacterized protein HMPREF1541_01643 [Cyphellophora europaea CBS 101466]ETN42487.1 hypothetical protein HMPREF1541_01643 [Cyphellophora europaea CBS 101466]
MGQKRRRLALSCVDCRRRKVKCGRELPSCVRCIKGGHGDACKYVSYDDKSGDLLTPTDESPEERRAASDAEESWTEEAETYYRHSKGGATSKTAYAVKRTAPQRSLEELQERVFELETYVRSAGSRPVSSEMFLGMGHPQGPGSRPKDTNQDFERSLLRGRSFKTQYTGPSNAASLLLQFEELSMFVKEILNRMPSFERSKDAVKRLQGSDAGTPAKKDPTELDLQTFVAMVPPKQRADALVQEYFDVLETTYRVLHIPSFQANYEAFWTNPQAADIEFVAQLLIVMAAMNCVVAGGVKGFLGRSSVGREDSHRWIEAAEAWLNKQSHKHTTLEYYQTNVLLIIAKRMTCYKVKREWVISQNLLSLAMAAGFHREPTYLSTKISPFDQEMRRRLWFSILELDIQSCCDRGMRAAIAPDDWDCLPPLNIHDEDFNETTQTMPSPKPLTDFTRTSFLCKLVQHLPLRLEMLTRINSISRTLELDTVMAFDSRIRAELDGLPVWTEKSVTRAPKALSSLVLHEYLLLLHQPFATQHLAQSQYFYSRCTRRESALSVIKRYCEMPETHALAFSNLRDDAFRASLATCHDIAVASGGREDLMQDKSLAVDLITKYVDLLGRRVKSLGQGFHSYWINSSALSLVYMKMAPDPANADDFVLQAVNRMVQLHNDLMRMQTTAVGAKALTPMSEAVAQLEAPLPSAQPLIQPLPDGMPTFDTLSGTMFDFDFDDSFAWWDTGAIGLGA